MTLTMLPIVTARLAGEADVVVARRHARRISELLGFTERSRAEIATAIGEIARNAATHGGGGHVEFALDSSAPAALVVTVSDDGPGIAALDAMLAGQFANAAGLRGARRLSDRFEIQTGTSGTRVLLATTLPAGHGVKPAVLAETARRLASDDGAEPVDEIVQSRELLRSLGQLKDSQAEGDRLRELGSTRHSAATLHADPGRRVAAAITEHGQTIDGPQRRDDMAAIAEAAGSIAHDFNNALQIVTSNLEILGRGLPEDAGRARHATDNAMEGARRAIALTRRLLDLSRR